MTRTRDVAADAARLAGGWSEVRAADHTTRYMRLGMGSGAPVIVLVPGEPEANLWPEVFDSLAVGRRVFIPDLPDAPDSFGPRFSAFLDASR